MDERKWKDVGPLPLQGLSQIRCPFFYSEKFHFYTVSLLLCPEQADDTRHICIITYTTEEITVIRS